MIRLLIIGAGEAGRMVAREVLEKAQLVHKYCLIGFLDDDPSKRTVLNKPVLGKIDDAKEAIADGGIDEVIIAIPSASKDTINRIIRSLSSAPVKVRIVPGIYEIIEGDVSFGQVREVRPEDLLGREEIGFDREQIAAAYDGRTVFVTGAGGSIGSEIFMQLLQLPVKKAVAYGHGENSIHSLILKAAHDKRFAYVIGDIRDSEKLDREMARFRPDIVFHAAAHKHVPLMEEYPDEAVKNNIFGTCNAATAAIKNGAGRFLFVSTDKAINPTSVMGATKRLAEKIVLSLNASQKVTRFSLTRFGNVLGSRGSVIPIFQEQVRMGGPVTVTSPEMTRFFMSIREAARLVIKSAALDAGSIFVLDMGKPVRIIDLAKSIIRFYGYDDGEIPIAITGLRPGEKLYEEVLTEREDLKKSSFDKLFISGEDDGLYGEKELEAVLDDLKKAAGTYDAGKIKETLRRYVPEYQPGPAAAKGEK